jgi:hypothetical protein
MGWRTMLSPPTHMRMQVSPSEAFVSLGFPTAALHTLAIHFISEYMLVLQMSGVPAGGWGPGTRLGGAPGAQWGGAQATSVWGQAPSVGGPGTQLVGGAPVWRGFPLPLDGSIRQQPTSNPGPWACPWLMTAAHHLQASWRTTTTGSRGPRASGCMTCPRNTAVKGEVNDWDSERDGVGCVLQRVGTAFYLEFNFRNLYHCRG